MILLTIFQSVKSKPTTELLNGLTDRISVSSVIGETRDNKETQRSHIFNIKFKLPIVNNGIEDKNDKKKSDGYSLKDGKKEHKKYTYKLRGLNISHANHVWSTDITYSRLPVAWSIWQPSLTGTAKLCYHTEYLTPWMFS